MVEYYPEPTSPPPVQPEEEVDAPMDPDELEEIEDLSEAEKREDPLRFIKVKRLVDGVEYIGFVEDIEKGSATGDRLYRIKYTDGDFEHLTAPQVVESKFQEEAIPPLVADKDDILDLAGSKNRQVRQIADDEESLICAPTFSMLKRPANRIGNNEAPPVREKLAKIITNEAPPASVTTTSVLKRPVQSPSRPRLSAPLEAMKAAELATAATASTALPGPVTRARKAVESRYQEAAARAEALRLAAAQAEAEARQLADDEESSVGASTINMLKRPASRIDNDEALRQLQVLKKPAGMPSNSSRPVGMPSNSSKPVLIPIDGRRAPGRPRKYNEADLPEADLRKRLLSKAYHRALDAVKRQHRGGDGYDHEAAKNFAREESRKWALKTQHLQVDSLRELLADRSQANEQFEKNTLLKRPAAHISSPRQLGPQPTVRLRPAAAS